MYNYDFIKKNDGTWGTAIKRNLDIIKGPIQVTKGTSNYIYPSSEYKVRIAYLYRRLKKDYECMRFYEIIIDEYLKPTDKKTLMEMEKDMYELSKDYYCEARIAIETNPIWWDTYRSGVGKRFYYLLLE